MSTTAAHPEAAASEALDTAVVVSWKTPIVYGVITVLAAVLFVVARQDGDAVFRISSRGSSSSFPRSFSAASSPASSARCCLRSSRSRAC